MAVYLPLPYPDETLPSVLTRYAQAMGGLYDLKGPKDRRTRSGEWAPPLWRNSRFQLLVSESMWCWGWSLEQVVERLTLFPYLARGMTRDDASRVVSGLSQEPFNVSRHVRLTAAGRLRYCASCFSEDDSSNRQRYFRRSHQLPGVLFCYLHGVTLRELEVGFPQDFVVSNEENDRKPCAPKMSESQRVSAVLVAKRSHEMLQPGEPIAREETLRRWRTIAEDAFFSNHIKSGVNQAAFDATFREFFGLDYLKAVINTSYSNIAPAHEWLSKLSLSDYPGMAAYIRFEVFFEAIESGKFSLRNSEASHDWPFCPNEYADHGRTHKVDYADPGDGAVRRAECRCGCTFTFSGVSDGRAMGVRIRSHGPHFRAAALEMLASGIPSREVARRLGVSAETVLMYAREGKPTIPLKE